VARIAIGGFQHETNTFASNTATIEDFVLPDAWPPLSRGADLIDAVAGINIPIAGFIERKEGRPPGHLYGVAAEMAGILRHRGPDDGGVWTDAPAGVALAHRRLAVRDLSAAGHQPMVSADGRYALVYNGEIYDIDGLKSELEGRGHRFRGHSDTEVLLYALQGQGHAWPGGKPGIRYGNLDEPFTGLSASAIIWDFFKNHAGLGLVVFGHGFNCQLGRKNRE